jgi:pyruvate/2-oxoglutarate/acetoin dehydrogenase E1 component
MPSTAYDAKGLIKSAIRDNNPVLFFEHFSLYQSVKEEIPEEEYLIPLGKADVKRKGKDLTIVATGLMVHRTLNAADRLAEEGISAEVIDPRTIAPLDETAILNSVKKTGRLIIVHEARKTGGVGSEIAATVNEKAFTYLKSPILRIGAPDVPNPYSAPLEKAFVPDEEIIAAKIRSLF